MLCVDVVAECDRYRERWERGVCPGKEGGPRSGGGGQSVTIHPRLG